MRNKRLTYGLVAAGLAAALPASLALKSGPVKDEGGGNAPPVVVSAARVRRADLERVITLAAEFEPFQDVSVHAKVAGYLRSIRVDVGDHVRKGETIAVLEIPELNDDLRHAVAATGAAKEEIKRAEARHEEVHLASGRLLQVAAQRPNLVAQQDLDAARDQDQAAEAALASARQSVEENEANEGRIHTMLGYAVITAPFDGVITRRYADTGALIQAGTSSNTQAMPVVSLAEDRLLRLVFPVPESVVPFVREGTPVGVDVQSLQRKFAGKVVRFSGQVDRATRTMQTEVDVPNPDLRITPGMYASVSVVLEKRKDALSVPVQAVAGGTALVVGAGGALEKRDVELGLATPDRVEVVDGLKQDELVVIGGRTRVRPGDRVEAKVQAEPSPTGGRP
jgi:RND family efflux transporter MFP subunit